MDLGRVYVRDVWTHEEYDRRSNVKREWTDGTRPVH